MDQLHSGVYFLPDRHPAVCAGRAGEIQSVFHLRLADRLHLLSGAGSDLCPLLPGAAGKGEPQRTVYLLHPRPAGIQHRSFADPELFLALSVGADHGHGKPGRFRPALHFQLLYGAVPIFVPELPHGTERPALHHSGRVSCGGDKAGLSGGGLRRRHGADRHRGSDGADGTVLSGMPAAAAQPI